MELTEQQCAFESYCISQWNKNSKSEILEINKAFNLLFVNWYRYNIIKND